ncbi:MAG: pilus assembly protein [Armatimonadetes bacterium]|nr:pilus assembly protein [Armatimonadota bacterium]
MIRHRRRQSGQGLIETTFVALFMSILMLGILGFGRVLSASIRLEAAAREGARQAGWGASNAIVQSKALQTLSQTGNAANIPGSYWMKITPVTESARVFNSTVKVEMWWNYPVPVPLFNLFVRQRLLYANNTQVVTVNPVRQ